MYRLVSNVSHLKYKEKLRKFGFLKHTYLEILPVCPSELIQSKVERQSPESKLQTLIVESKDPEIIFRPSAMLKVVTEFS